MGIIGTAFLASVRFELPTAALIASIILVIVSIVFSLLDKRMRSLIRIGEEALKEQQMYLSNTRSQDSIQLVQKSDALVENGQTTFTRAYLILQTTVLLLGIGATVFAILNLMRSYPL